MTDNLLPKLSSATLPWPADWAQIFGADRPLILDIGFGYGHTLAHLHKTRPDHHIIGVEIDNACLTKAEKAIRREGMDNVRVVRSRAETALHHLFSSASLHEVHANFPDPWFKSRHAGRRLMQRDTLDTIVNRLVPGGRFYLAMDIVGYAKVSAELLAGTPGLTALHETPWVHSWPGRIVTKYERKARKAGRDCYYFAYRRNDTPAPLVPVIKELEMPHLVIKTPLNLDAMMSRFQTETTYACSETRIRFMNRYRNEGALLFEVYVHEPTIEQRIAVVLVRRQEANEYLLKLSGLGNPRATGGLHFAVGTLGKILVGLHPEAEILETKIHPKYR